MTNTKRISSRVDWLNEVYGTVESKRLSSKDRDVGLVLEIEGHFPT